jgi:hypothetical protein
MNLQCILQYKPGMHKSQATEFCTVAHNMCIHRNTFNSYSITDVGVNYMYKQPHILHIKYAMMWFLMDICQVNI